jgi:hypothetical protein
MVGVPMDMGCYILSSALHPTGFTVFLNSKFVPHVGKHVHVLDPPLTLDCVTVLLAYGLVPYKMGSVADILVCYRCTKKVHPPKQSTFAGGVFPGQIKAWHTYVDINRECLLPLVSGQHANAGFLVMVRTLIIEKLHRYVW